MIETSAELETASERRQEQLREYNYEHYRSRHILADAWRLARGEGVRPGREAPDFELESTKGQRLRLSALRGRPVMLHFSSFT